jgi:arabinogalactan oligomer/maltooligosaccharide transport system substrate-binding protein
MKLWKGVLSGVTALSMVGGLVASGTSVASADSSVPSGQTITLWAWQGGAEFTSVQKLANEWGKIHGDTVNVVDQSKNANGFQFYATAARTGKGPDVLFGMPHDNNGKFAQEGLLAPVPSGVLNSKDYAQSVLDAVTIQGKQYSLPVSVQTIALYYNKSMIKTPPKNWAQFSADATKYGFGYDQANLYNDFTLIGGMGGYVFKNKGGTLDPKDIGLASPGAVKAFQLMRDMVSKYHWMTPTTTGAIAKQQFVSKKIGMYISGAWDTNDIAAAKVPYGIAKLPTLPNGHAETPFLGVITTFVSARSANQAADWSLAEFLSSKQAQLQYFNVSQQVPALTSLQNSVTVKKNPLFQAFAAETANAIPMPNIPEMQSVWSAMSVIGNIIEGKVTPAAGAKDFVANIKKGIQVQNS